MARFGRTSLRKRQDADTRWQEILDEAIKHYNFSIVWTHRNRESQNVAHASGNSKLEWPKSKHNALPSLAVDIIPYPTGWSDLTEFREMATYIYAAAMKLGYKIKWGGHWKNYTGKGDLDRDWAHFQLED